MRKILLCICGLLICFSACRNPFTGGSGSDNSDKDYDVADKEFSYRVPMLALASLKLDKSGNYEAEYASEGLYWYNRGTYKVEGDHYTLHPEICSTHKDDTNTIPCEKTLGVATCSYKDIDYSFYYSRVLVCRSSNNTNPYGYSKLEDSLATFNDLNKTVPAGQTRTFKGIDVVTMGAEKGITSDDVKIRETPSVDGKVLQYFKSIFGDDGRFPYVPKGTALTVLARTAEKSQVNNWNNYWYLVDVDCSQHVWMFGEFVTLKQ